MKTGFILIIMTGAYYGNNTTAVPGFDTIETCERAAAAFVEKSKTIGPRNDERRGAFCIPGQFAPK